MNLRVPVVLDYWYPRARDPASAGVRAPAHGRGRRARPSLSGAGPSGARRPQNGKDSGVLGACVRFFLPSRSRQIRLVALRPRPPPRRMRITRRAGRVGARRGRWRDKRRLRLPPAWPADPATLRTTTCSAPLVARSLPPSSSISTRPRRPTWPCLQQRLRSVLEPRLA
jgi:hypothetical protein